MPLTAAAPVSRLPLPNVLQHRMKRSEHQVCVVRPRALRTLIPFSTVRDRYGDGTRPYSPIIPFDHANTSRRSRAVIIGQPTFVVDDHQVGQCFFLLDHFVDLLRENACADELAHLHRAPLSDSEYLVCRLVFYRRVFTTDLGTRYD